MYSDKKNVLQLVALLRAHGVRRAVLCPGSRNVPLVQAFATCDSFECFSVTDERSAGFFAIGLALHVQAPVVVCCTSGSALLNLHPAVCEAFYRRVPLVVVSADRPAAWIGQMDGQTLPQPGVFGGLVRKAVNLPEVRTEEDEWYANRLVNETLLEVDHHGYGPVHINVPLSEPLFHFTAEALPSVRRMVRRDMSDEGRTLAFFLKEELPKYRRVLVVSGQMSSDEAVGVAACLSGGRVAWLTEVLGNCPSASDAVRGFDALLYAAREEDLQALRPDLVITVGGHVVSKRLKRLAELDLHSIEQPIRAGQWDEMAGLTSVSPLPVAFDEELIGHCSLEAKRRLLDALHPQYIVLKPSLHGGFSGCREWIEEAEKRNVGWWITSALESNVGLNAIAQWCATWHTRMPQGLGTGMLFTDNVPMPLEIRKDCLWYVADGD